MKIAQPADHPVQGLRGAAAVGPSVTGELGVDALHHVGGGRVVDRPEGGDDLAIARVVDGRGQRDQLVGEIDTTGRRLARRQERELALIGPGR